jgi:hypothetical protein
LDFHNSLISLWLAEFGPLIYNGPIIGREPSTAGTAPKFFVGQAFQPDECPVRLESLTYEIPALSLCLRSLFIHLLAPMNAEVGGPSVLRRRHLAAGLVV